MSAVHRLQAMASHQEWNDVENWVSHYLMLTDLLGTPTPIAQLCKFWIYTIEVVSAAHHLRAMASQPRWNYIETQVSHYFMPADLSGSPTPIAQLCTFYNIRLK